MDFSETNYGYPSLLPSYYIKDLKILKHWRYLYRKKLLDVYTREYLINNMSIHWKSDPQNLINIVRDYVILEKLPEKYKIVNKLRIKRNLCLYLSLRDFLPSDIIRLVISFLEY